ncbi:hypothetical protein MUK42_31585 [Musa troglodytarum]|uniref:Uncharacterized protein n=1 Tax=Musa troglodytarum TaxID=320322 RepID=A0A9E7FKT6_9LILI|nr:hypothetical protein MUK42_31585 [Musa troglodytarum]
MVYSTKIIPGGAGKEEIRSPAANCKVDKSDGSRNREQHESGSGRMVLEPDFCSRTDNRVRVSSVDLLHGPLTNTSTTTDSNGTDMASETSTSLAPLQLEARNAFGSNMQRSSARIAAAPNSGLGSPGLHPSHQSSLRAEELQELSSLSTLDAVATKGGSDLRINR